MDLAKIRLIASINNFLMYSDYYYPAEAPSFKAGLIGLVLMVRVMRDPQSSYKSRFYFVTLFRFILSTGETMRGNFSTTTLLVSNPNADASDRLLFLIKK